MIQKIRNSRWTKGLVVLLCMNLLSEIFTPTISFALTGGPAQPEFSSFSPVGTSDMVNLSSGDFTYNIPLMDVGGYPISLGYNSGIGMDDEASWVGLGWDLSVGQINRNVRGIPDDFDGDEINYKNNSRSNITIGTNFNFQPGAFGVDLEVPGDSVFNADNVNMGVSLTYNNATGVSAGLSLGVNADLAGIGSVGLSANSGPDGLALRPSLSMSGRVNNDKLRLNSVGGSIGTSFNSRQGLTNTTLGMNFRSTDVKSRKKGKKERRSSSSSFGSTIGYTNNTYTPSRRLRMRSETFTFNAALGAEFFGGEGQGQITGYGIWQRIGKSDRDKDLKAYGYLNTEKGDKVNSVYDFNREKDGNVSVNTTNLPLANYTHDIFVIKGQGIGGTFRPYRNQVGYLFDSEVKDLSNSLELGAEFGTGNAVHLGVDVEGTVIDGKSNLWEDDNYALGTFEESFGGQADYEKVTFKQVGDLTADQEFSLFENSLKGYDPIRVGIEGDEFNRNAAKKYEVDNVKVQIGNVTANAVSSYSMPSSYKRQSRQLRNQSISYLTVEQIKNGIGYGPIAFDPSENVNNSSKDHHIGEYHVTRNDGARYIYGYPLYNIIKKETTFSVEGNTGDCESGLVDYTSGVDNSADNNHGEKYFNQITTPGYAHTYLLTSVLSTDYEDLTGDGPTSDDLGSYTKFTYNQPIKYKWRIPYEQDKASYNEGLRTELDDDKGNYVYGNKEIRYIKTIETKTHIAVFDYSDRKDAHGVINENGGLAPNQKKKKLKEIKLYALPEYEESITTGIPATPIKTVHFEYSYELCQGVPNNSEDTNLEPDELSNDGGKLTLKKVYFTYRESKMGKYSGYSFDYDTYNPDYNHKAYDIWGNYKPNDGNSCGVLGSPTVPEYNYVEQNNKVDADKYSSAWSMSKINLPSGGEITPKYETDEYAYVQNRKANQMFKIAGTGNNLKPMSSDIEENKETAFLYNAGLINKHDSVLYVEIDGEFSNPSDFYDTHLKDLRKIDGKRRIYFRFFTNVTKSGSRNIAGFEKNENNLEGTDFEYVTGYFELDDSKMPETNLINGTYYAGIPVKRMNREGGVVSNQQVNPISKATWNFGRKYLNQYIYEFTSGNSSSGAINSLGNFISNKLLNPNLIGNLFEVLSGPNGRLQKNYIGHRFVKEKSWIRLKEPRGKKYGGGTRVKEVVMSDIWEDMNVTQSDFETMYYGQEYDYDLPSGISSGVATYEPVGSKENPFVQPVFSTQEHLLAPNEENYVEEPFGESFFPSPTVTYSWVRVQNREAGSNSSTAMKINELNKTGYVVNTFYTSKDYPTITDQTRISFEEDESGDLMNLLNVYLRQHIVASQGYLIHLNDMDGKEESQRIFAEGQEEMLSGVYYNYGSFTSDPLGSSPDVSQVKKGKLNNKVKTILPNGQIKDQVIGVEYDVVNDFRENTTNTTKGGVNGNMAAFFTGFIPGIVPIFIPDFFRNEEQFRSTSTTKVVHSFGILKETVAYDAGAAVSTRNLAWDAMTGEVLVTETVDEYHDKYYSFNYPAHWYYDGMAGASKNINFKGKLNNINGNQYSLSNLPIGYNSSSILKNGDEVSIKDGSNFLTAWVVELLGNSFRLIDRSGDPVNVSSNSDLVIIRSGHRNLQSAGISSVTLMQNPLKLLNGNDASNLGTAFLESSQANNWRVIEASAVDYSDNWPAQCECDFDNISNPDYNPYVRNEKGVWRAKSSRTYLTGRDNKDDPTPRTEGYYNDFTPFYKLTGSNNWFKDDNLPWTFTQEVSKFSPYGFEVENKDALDRYSGAQYGYNHSFPMAVGANTKYSELAYDGFEDYSFEGCEDNPHFSFGPAENLDITNDEFHTGRHSLRVGQVSQESIIKSLECAPQNLNCDLSHRGLGFNLFSDHPGIYQLNVSANLFGGQSPYTYYWSIDGNPTGDFENYNIIPSTENQSEVSLMCSGCSEPALGDEICLSVLITDDEGCAIQITGCYTVASVE